MAPCSWVCLKISFLFCLTFVLSGSLFLCSVCCHNNRLKSTHPQLYDTIILGPNYIFQWSSWLILTNKTVQENTQTTTKQPKKQTMQNRAKRKLPSISCLSRHSARKRGELILQHSQAHREPPRRNHTYTFGRPRWTEHSSSVSLSVKHHNTQISRRTNVFSD